MECECWVCAEGGIVENISMFRFLTQSHEVGTKYTIDTGICSALCGLPMCLKNLHVSFLTQSHEVGTKYTTDTGICSALCGLSS